MARKRMVELPPPPAGASRNGLGKPLMRETRSGQSRTVSASPKSRTPRGPAKVLTEKQAEVALAYVASRVNHLRNRVVFLLSNKAGMRAIEIAGLRWNMVTDGDGAISDRLDLPAEITKTKKHGRVIPMHHLLRDALRSLRDSVDLVSPEQSVVGLSRGSIVGWFCDLYRSLGFRGCSSHSGRRTFITKLARQISLVGGSLRDVQQMAGHRNLGSTQLYIDPSEDAKRKGVDLV